MTGPQPSEDVRFAHTGEYCRDGGEGFDPECWACDCSLYDAALDAARAKEESDE